MLRYDESVTEKTIPELETNVQKFWQENKIFQQSVERLPVDNQFVLYDGPPFATGLPHYGHVLAHTIKDVIPRFQTMLGKRVERRFGWDCHGVPVEHQVQESLKLDGNAAIEKMGIKEFNEACESIVQKYTKEWRVVEDRLGRFVDMDNDYKTMDLHFMESVWATFKRVNDKGLVYEGKKVVAYSPELGTPLSDFEAKLNYKKAQDPHITLAFALENEPNTSLLVWTTTPWSVPGNVAIAINTHLDYVKVTTQEGKHFIVTKAAVEKYFKADAIVATTPVAANELVGMKYKPVFPIENAPANCFTLLASEHVTDSDGTGLVHIAPAFGEDDYKLGQQNQLPTVDYFNKNGCFETEIPGLEALNLSGKFFKEADKIIIKCLKQQGVLFQQGTLEHEYPFCWRTDKPLMYRAVSSWYVEVTAIKDKLIANNKQVNWYPSFAGEKRFHEWLTNARDWAISRSRYWGTPMPIWRNVNDATDCIVVGSLAEFTELTGVEVTNLHRQHIDHIPIMKDGARYERIPEVFDCWFESGAMPYAQAHYMFDNDEAFLKTFPANFIAEGLDQTRGWFYTLMVLATALFDKPAFKNCVVNGILLGDDGKKMSKSKRNYPDMRFVFDKYGADALRFLLMGSNATRAQEMKVSEKDIQAVSRQLLMPMLHIYKLFAQRANLENVMVNSTLDENTELTNPLDQWLFYATEQFKTDVKQCFETFDLIAACKKIQDFVDDFSKIYVRNSKNRFKYADKADVKQGLECMQYALDNLSKCVAPVIPFMAEVLYQSLYGLDKSVHLEAWPQAVNVQRYEKTYRDIETVKAVEYLGAKIRQEKEIELRQPLASISLSADLRTQLTPYVSLLQAMLNVENINWVDSADNQHGIKLINQVTLNKKVMGKKYKKELQILEAEFAKGNYVFSEGSLAINDKQLAADDFSVQAVPDQSQGAAQQGSLWVTMDTTITPELKEKGLLRKLLREIQRLRKECKYTPSDRITITLAGDKNFRDFVEKFAAQIAEHTISEVRCEENGNDASENAKTYEFNTDGLLGTVIMPKKPKLLGTPVAFFSAGKLNAEEKAELQNEIDNVEEHKRVSFN